MLFKLITFEYKNARNEKNMAINLLPLGYTFCNISFITDSIYQSLCIRKFNYIIYLLFLLTLESPHGRNGSGIHTKY